MVKLLIPSLLTSAFSADQADIEGYRDSLRRKPLGEDRFRRRYWLLPCTAPHVLLVEAGWMVEEPGEPGHVAPSSDAAHSREAAAKKQGENRCEAQTAGAPSESVGAPSGTAGASSESVGAPSGTAGTPSESAGTPSEKEENRNNESFVSAFEDAPQLLEVEHASRAASSTKETSGSVGSSSHAPIVSSPAQEKSDQDASFVSACEDVSEITDFGEGTTGSPRCVMHVLPSCCEQMCGYMIDQLFKQGICTREL